MRVDATVFTCISMLARAMRPGIQQGHQAAGAHAGSGPEVGARNLSCPVSVDMKLSHSPGSMWKERGCLALQGD